MVLPWNRELVGEPRIADAQGRVRIFDLGAAAELRARAQRDGIEYRGQISLATREIYGVDTVHRVVLQRAFEARVLVLDAAGAPAPGVPVAALILKDLTMTALLDGLGYAPTPGRGADLPSFLAGGISDANGRTVLLDPSDRVARALAAGETVSIEAFILAHPPVRASLDAAPTPQGYVLRLPPLGSVSIELPQENHAAVHEYANVELALDNTPAAQAPLKRTLDGGRVRFAYVGLDMQLTAKLHAFKSHGPFPFAGPKTAGEDVRFEIPLAPGQRIVQWKADWIWGQRVRFPPTLPSTTRVSWCSRRGPSWPPGAWSIAWGIRFPRRPWRWCLERSNALRHTPPMPASHARSPMRSESF